MPLGEGVAGSASVEVSADLRRLFDGFKEAEDATKRWDRSMAQNATRSTKELQKNTDALGKSFSSLSGGFRDAGRSAMNYTRDVQKAGDQTARAVSSTENSLAGLRRTFIASAGVIAGALGAREIVQLADSYTSFTNKLRSAGLEGQNLARTQEDLFQIAQRYGTELGTLGALYGRIAQAQNDLGVSGGQIAQATEGAAAALRLYGAGQAEANGALIQFSQMLGNAMPQMQEFNSINDGARPILQAVANGLDEAGGSISKLRQLILDQKITTKEFFDAYLRGIPQIIAEAEKMPLTIGASLQRLNNALGKYIGETDKSLNATQQVSQAIGAMADNLDTVMPIITGLAVALGTKYAAAAGAATVATIAKTAADVRATLAAEALAAAEARTAGLLLNTSGAANVAAGSVSRLAVAQGTAARAGSGLVALMGGPWVAAATALAAVIYLLYRRHQEAEAEIASFNEHARNAERVLADEAARAQSAGREIKQLGNDHSNATSRVKAFAGATGDAAQALWDQAKAARAARLEVLAKARDEAKADRDAAAKRFTQASQSTQSISRFGYLPDAGRDKTQTEAMERFKKAGENFQKLSEAYDKALREPLTNFVSPNVKTGGRDIGAEIEALQKDLVAANKSGNEGAQREILKQIKLREKITRYMKDGLSFEIAMATAQAEGLGAAEKASDTMAFTADMAEDALADIGATITSGKRSTAKQAELYAKYKAGKGPLAAAPGTSLHEQDRARDIAKTPGMTLDKIREAFESRGAKIVELLDEGTHFHVAWAKTAKSQYQVAQEQEKAEDAALRNEERFQSEMASIRDDILHEQQNRQINPDDEADIAAQRIKNERDRFAEEVKNRVGLEQLNAAQAAQLTLANEQLRVEQLRTVEMQESRRVQEERNATTETLLEAETDLLNVALGMADTDKERRDIQLRIIDAEAKLEDFKLAQLLLAADTTEAMKEQIAIQREVNALKSGAAKQDVLDQPYVEFADGFANALGRATESVLALENPLSILRNFLMDLTKMFNEQFIVNPIKDWAKDKGKGLAKDIIGEKSPIDPAAIKTAGTLQVLDLAASNAAQALAMMSTTGGGGGGFLGSLLSIAGSAVGGGGGLNVSGGPITGIDNGGIIDFTPGFASGTPNVPEGKPFWVGEGGKELMRRRGNQIEVMSHNRSREFVAETMKQSGSPSFGGKDGLIGAAIKMMGGNTDRSINFGNIIVQGAMNRDDARRSAKQLAAELQGQLARSARQGIRHD